MILFLYRNDIIDKVVKGDSMIVRDLYFIMMKNGIGNMRQCKTMIKHGHVQVNKEVVLDVCFPICMDDTIEVDGKTINTQPFLYYMLNKPKGYICANHDKLYPCVLHLFKEKDCYCVGRLDRDTTGLLLITNDKSLSKKLLLPQNHVYKEYYVTVEKPLDQNIEEKFLKGVIIDKDVVCHKAYLERKDDFHCYVRIDEGKYHQIKKMFLSCHNKVVELKRVKFKDLVLDSFLEEGEYRKLIREEIESLYE